MGASAWAGLWTIVAGAWRWPAALLAAPWWPLIGWRGVSNPGPANPRAEGGGGAAWPGAEAVSAWLTLPFEWLRAQHAVAVLAGVVPKSALESARFDRALDAAERLALGPFARRR